MEACEEVTVTVRLLRYIKLVTLSHTKHSHCSKNVSAASAFDRSPFFIEGQVKLHEGIFLTTNGSGHNTSFLKVFFGNAGKRIHHPDKNPHTFKEIETNSMS